MMNKIRNKLGQFASNQGNGQTKGARLPRVAPPNSEVEQLIANAVFSRQQLIRELSDPRRNINHECGYLETHTLTSTTYREMYDREAIAARVVQVMPDQCWKMQPTVFDDEDPNTETPFELAWKEVDKQLRGENWYEPEEGSVVWNYLRRADILSGIASYGVILLGVDDGLPLQGELVFGQEGPLRSLTFLRVFDESLARITRFETDETNPRFGEPVEYSLTLADPSQSLQASAGENTRTIEVHWTRIVHIADNLGSSEIFGVPRMRPVWNRLQDLRKLYGGSAEMYWKGAFPGLSIETHPQLGGQADTSKVKDVMEQYENGLQRYLAMTGVSVKSLAPQVVDPTPQIDTQIEAICIQLNIPKRKFTGSERGELASSQDTGDWNDVLRARQNGYLTPRVIVPFVNRLVQIGVLPEPSDGYNVVWPNLDELSATDQATVALQRTEAMEKYVRWGVEALVPPMNYLTQVLSFTTEEAESILEVAMKQAREDLLTVPEEPEEPTDEPNRKEDA